MAQQHIIMRYILSLERMDRPALGVSQILILVMQSSSPGILCSKAIYIQYWMRAHAVCMLALYVQS
jgi:hypothetical protein